MLEVDLLNMNAVMHPPLMIGNAGWIESTAGDFRIYREGAPPALSRLMEALDAERVALAGRLGVPTVAFVDYLRDAGYTTAEAAATNSVHRALQAGEAIGTVARRRRSTTVTSTRTSAGASSPGSISPATAAPRPRSWKR